MKAANNVIRGRTAKAAGDAFEAWVEAQHAGAIALGALVHVVHNQPQAKYIGGRLIYVAKSGTDYSGVLSDGRAFVAEAKSTKKRLMRSEIKKKQVEQLDAVAKVGGVAFLLVEFRLNVIDSITPGIGTARLQQFRYAIPWKSVSWRKLKSADSIGIEDMQLEWQVRVGECYLKRGVSMPAASGGRKRVFPRE